MSIENRAREGMAIAREGMQDAVDRIPPEAWPFIDMLFKITVGLAVLWLLLAIVAWWRRRAYNLTVASTARVNRKAQPDFLRVDHDAREAAIARGEAHEKMLEEREEEEALAALKAAKEPLTLAARFASIATFLMSLFTLVASFVGAVGDVTRMNGYLQEASAAERIEYIVREHPIGCAIVAFVIVFNIWRYVAEKKWGKV